jgi:hypothetical protein
VINCVCVFVMLRIEISQMTMLPFHALSTIGKLKCVEVVSQCLELQCKSYWQKGLFMDEKHINSSTFKKKAVIRKECLSQGRIRMWHVSDICLSVDSVSWRYPGWNKRNKLLHKVKKTWITHIEKKQNLPASQIMCAQSVLVAHHNLASVWLYCLLNSGFRTRTGQGQKNR